MKAMIFAAGLGSRLKPITDNKPKALVEINGVTLLEITIKNLIHYGFTDIIVNVHHFAQQVIDFLQSKHNFGITINISDESDLLLDTGGGLKKAARFVNDGNPFLVHNVDIISNIDLTELYNFHLQNNCLATLACMKRDSSRQFLINQKDELCGWKNNSTGELKISRPLETDLLPIAFCGISVINPQMPAMIDEDGVFSIINVYLRLSTTHSIKTFSINNVKWVDVGTIENINKLNFKN